MNETKGTDNHQITKWLRIVMYTAIISLANTLAGLLSFLPGSVTTWTGRVLVTVMILSLFKLATENDRYRKAGIFRAVMLALAIGAEFLPAATLLTLVVSILSIVSEYQEYHAHSELIAEKDPNLSGKWSSLFLWSILAGVLVGFASTVAVLLIAMLEMETRYATPMIIAVLAIPQYIIEVLYILYIKKMMTLFPEE